MRKTFWALVPSLILLLVPVARAQDTNAAPASAPGASSVETSLPAPNNPAADLPGWKLVFDDEFDKPGLPDPAKWSYEIGKVRNHELQYYTDARIENAEVKSDGILHLVARKEPYQGADYTSASITGRDRFAFTYGRVEIRAKIPGGLGTWPALWSVGTARNHGVKWPDFGEIDILENVAFQPDVAHFTVHVPKYEHDKAHPTKAVVTVPNFPQDFHTYALEWDAQKLVWYLDGKQVYEFDNDGTGIAAWPFDKPQYLIINLAYGGSWGGMKGIDDSVLPADFQIDYVRIYQKP